MPDLSALGIPLNLLFSNRNKTSLSSATRLFCETLFRNMVTVCETIVVNFHYSAYYALKNAWG